MAPTAEPAPAQPPALVFHVQLRHFPHNLCRFNLDAAELHASIVEPWVGERWIELGERKWSPHEAKLTVLEGPPIPVEKLSMGRGWRIAVREGRDVTAELLAAGPAPPAVPPAVPPADLLADSLGLELLAAIGEHTLPLRRAWELALARAPDRGLGECLSLAERAVDSLLRAQLIVLAGGGEARGALRRIDAWAPADGAADGDAGTGPAGVTIRRAGGPHS